jgi:hypothetical protein
MGHIDGTFVIIGRTGKHFRVLPRPLRAWRFNIKIGGSMRIRGRVPERLWDTTDRTK